MRTEVLVAISMYCSVTVACIQTVHADPPGDFPLLRTVGEADALTDIEDSYATETVSTASGVLTGIALVVPDPEEWAGVAEVSADTTGVGAHVWGASGASLTVEVLNNNTNSAYGGVVGFLTTLIEGGGTAFALVSAGSNETWSGITIQQNAGGVFVAYNGEPVLVAGGDGVPLEITLPVSPGQYISIAAGATVPNAVESADQGSATAAVSVIPLDAPPLARIVIRDERGDIVDSWEEIPPT